MGEQLRRVYPEPKRKLLKIVERDVRRRPFDMTYVRPMKPAFDAERFLRDTFLQAHAPHMFCQPAPEVRVDVFAVSFGHGPEVRAT